MHRSLRTLSCSLIVLFALVGRVSGADYIFRLVDETGLNPAEFSIFAMGFSTADELVLGPAGTMVSQNSGTISSYKVGTGAGELSEIRLDTITTFTGGRYYFFTAPVGTPAPTVEYGKQPTDPPNAPIPPQTPFPPFSIVELTVPPATPAPPGPAPTPLPTAHPATVDIQTVDGFIFPLTITLNGQTNVAGQQYGQPIYPSGQTPTVNRADIFTAYASFMAGEGTAGAAFAGLTFAPSSIDGQAGGILNPRAYLTAVTLQNEYLNLSSPLNAIFDADLATLFSSSTLNVSGVSSNPAGIDKQNYSATPVMRDYPGTTVSLPALKFTGVTDPSREFYVFSPLGLSVLRDASGDQITGTITTDGASNSVLTLASAVTGLEVGMYVSGTGLSPGAGGSTTQITAINGNALTLNQSIPAPAGGHQYQFCKLPQLVMFQTPGQMVLGNSGVFADNTIQFAANTPEASVLGNLENQVVSALNRGVGVVPEALNPAGSGGTSAIWGDQRTWYPSGAVQNLFSLFMHVGQIGGEPIFFRPVDAATFPNARGQVMGSAYGFAFDENGGPVGPAPDGQPEVPSKFDGDVPPGATMDITFGPWKKAIAPTPTPTPTPTPAPTPSPEPPPKVKVQGKKQIKTTKNNVKVKGTAVGQRLFVKYKKKPGKVVTKRVKIQPNGKWVFKFKPKVRKTLMKFYAEDSEGDRSKVQKVKVIDKSE